MFLTVKKGAILCLIAAFIFVLAACSSNNGSSKDADTSSQEAVTDSATNVSTDEKKRIQTIQAQLKLRTR